MNKVTILNLGFIVIVGTGVGAQLGLFLLDVAAKNILLLLLATITCGLLFRATSATRHIVWSASLATLLAMPLLSLVVPQWNVLPEWMAAESQPIETMVAQTESIQLPPRFEESSLSTDIPMVAETAIQPVATNTRATPVEASESSPFNVSVTAMLSIWCAGVLICLLPMLIGCMRLRKLEKASLPNNQETRSRIEQKVIAISRQLKISPPRIFFGFDDSMPMVWQWPSGSRLLLPTCAFNWTDERLNIVLLHELVHLRRKDPLTLVIGQLAVALNWFNPLAWFAFRQMKVERERCCDDYVLRSGVIAESYASCLLDLATCLQPSRFESVALSMATKSKVESRLKLILDRSLNRRRIGVVSASTLLALVTIIAALLSSLATGENGKNDDEDNVEIKWPFCELKVDDLPTRSIEDALGQFNEDSNTSPIGSTQPPIEKQEIIQAIRGALKARDFDANAAGVLQKVLNTGQMPPNVFLRRFTRFDDGQQMHGVWWVRLNVVSDHSSPHSVTIRNRHVFSRPYTLLERKQIASGQLMLLNRLSAYYQSLPQPAKLIEDLSNRPQRLARDLRNALTQQDREKVLALFNFTDVGAPIREFAESEVDLLLQSKINSVRFRYRELDGQLIHWQGFQKWKPNLPIAGFIEVDYTPPGFNQSKTISLEVGKTERGFYQLAGYVSGPRVPMPKTIRPAMGVRGETFPGFDKLPVVMEPAPIQPVLMTWTVSNPGKLTSGHLSNEEIWLRDVQAIRTKADVEIENVNTEAGDVVPESDDLTNDADEEKAEPQIPEQIWVSGTVVDKETGELIPQGIIVQAGKFDPDDADAEIQWGFSESHNPNANGKFRASIRPSKGWTARILVAGYLPEPIDIDSLPKNEARPKVTLKLTPGYKVSGRITDHRKMPVAGANVFAIGPTGLNVYGGQAYRHGQIDKHAIPVVTDSDGRFKDLVLDASGRIGITSPRMYAWPHVVAAGEHHVDIQLPEPATLVIKYNIDGAPEVANMLMQMLTYSMGDDWKGLQLERSELELRRGETTISGLPPGPYQIFRNVMVMFVKNGHSIPLQRQFFNLESGKTYTVDWTATGPDTGSRIGITAKWNREIPIDGMMFTVQSKEATKDLQGTKNWPNNMDGGKVDLESGKILTSRLPPGEYTMIVQIQKPISDERLQYSGIIGFDYTKKVDFSVPRGGPAEIELADIVLDDFK